MRYILYGGGEEGEAEGAASGEMGMADGGGGCEGVTTDLGVGRGVF